MKQRTTSSTGSEVRQRKSAVLTLATAHDFVVTMMLYVLYLCYAIAAIMVVISALQIYFKMQNGEGEISKSIQMLIGACLFMIGASIVFPAFFGYQI